MNTIAQISTPLGSGGISVIRVSGKDSLKIAKSIFHLKKMWKKYSQGICTLETFATTILPNNA